MPKKAARPYPETAGGLLWVVRTGRLQEKSETSMDEDKETAQFSCLGEFGVYCS